MTLFQAIFAFIMIWWVVLFTVLPWRIEREPSSGLGHDAGAPRHARIGLKFLITTGISLIILAGVYALATYTNLGEVLRGL